MKTPREILLARHRAAAAKLDVLRHNVLAQELPEVQARLAARRPIRVESRRLWHYAVWRELVWPCRRAWVGLAAGWVLIAALHLFTGEAQPARAAETRGRSLEAVALLQAQVLLRAELLGANSDVPAESVRFAPRPRSERAPASEGALPLGQA